MRPTCHVRFPDVLLCYDSSAASDVQCPTLCSIRRSFCCRATYATPRLQQRNTRMISCIPVLFTSFGTQRCRQMYIDLLDVNMLH